MSRSYKKHPVSKDYTGPKAKRQANKKVRRLAKDIDIEIINGSHYKDFTDRWELHDQRWYQSKQKAIKDWEGDFAMGITYCTRDEVIKDWEKYYKRK